MQLLERIEVDEEELEQDEKEEEYDTEDSGDELETEIITHMNFDDHTDTVTDWC